MPIGQAVQQAAMLFAIVFLVLTLLYFCIVVIFGAFRKFQKKPAAQGGIAPSPTPDDVQDATIASTYTGKLRLKNVDEQTAAMVMAIVSDESGIPLSELQFKSISLIDSPAQAKEESA